jgi:hypothetical protein
MRLNPDDEDSSKVEEYRHRFPCWREDGLERPLGCPEMATNPKEMVKDDSNTVAG